MILERVANNVSMLGWPVRNLTPMLDGMPPRRGARGVVVGFCHGGGTTGDADWLVQWEDGSLHFCNRHKLDTNHKPRAPQDVDMDHVKATLIGRAIIFEITLADGSRYYPRDTYNHPPRVVEKPKDMKNG